MSSEPLDNEPVNGSAQTTHVPLSSHLKDKKSGQQVIKIVDGVPRWVDPKSDAVNDNTSKTTPELPLE